MLNDVPGRRLRRLLVTTVTAGTAAVVFSAALVATQPVPARWRLLLSGALVIACYLGHLHLRWGHNSESFTWAEVALLTSLVLLPAPWVVLLVAGLVPLANLAQHIRAYKACFNAATSVLGVGLASGTATLVGLAVPDTGGRVVPLAAGMVVFFFWTGFAVSLAVDLSQGRPPGTSFREGLHLRVLVGLGNIATGVGLVLLGRHNPASLLVLPPLVAVLFLGNRGYLQARAERDLWKHLDAASRELNRLDEETVAHAALRRARELFRADWVELDLREGRGAAGEVYRDEGLLDTRERRHRRADQVDTDTCLVAPLLGPETPFGTLRVGFRGRVRLTGRESQVLTTFAHTVSVCLLNARLHERVRSEAIRHAHAARHDSLTGLANRARLHDLAERALLQAARDRRCCGLLLLDLDHFKEVNDTLGHGAGDAMLQRVAHRLRRSAKSAATVARLGGDEFAILLPDLPDADVADGIAGRLLETLSDPFVVDGLRLSVEASIGVACYPKDGATVQELLQRADIALYRAKDSRGSVRHYDSHHDGSSVDRLAMVADLRSALEFGELVLHYQPQVDLATGDLVSVEVLTRWHHPTRGLLPPSEFIAVAEHSGLIRAFTRQVIDRALEECATWRAAGVDLAVAVNLSSRNLLDVDLPDDVAASLVDHGVPAGRLIVEITETTMMRELDVVENVLARLRAIGVEVSVDDFGTGYSSLALLKRVAVNEVKVDQTFVRNMLESENDLAIVRATIDLAHGLGLRVVAEGVESERLEQALRAMGCDRAQGFHLGRPRSSAETWQVLRLPGLVPPQPAEPALAEPAAQAS